MVNDYRKGPVTLRGRNIPAQLQQLVRHGLFAFRSSRRRSLRHLVALSKLLLPLHSHPVRFAAFDLQPRELRGKHGASEERQPE